MLLGVKMPSQEPKLLGYLKRTRPELAGRLVDLRELLKTWLAFTPATFAHFTQHTVDHSDEIIRQLSQLLFAPGSMRPTVPFSPMEVYLLCAAAYCHDAGMVVSDDERIALLGSEAWDAWLDEEPTRRSRCEQIEARRVESCPEPHIRYFLADRELRFLLAEYFRTRHAERSGDVVRYRLSSYLDGQYGDPAVARTVADICSAHGLDRYELRDDSRFPQLRDVNGDTVNVEFLARLLRVGDLLDVRAARACPLLVAAASPLPVESVSHWDQYQRITSRHTGPDEILIRADCLTADEHRLLRDWCQWIVDEVRDLAIEQRHAKRHADWRPPRVGFVDPDATIHIAPAAGAPYVPVDWRIELDNDAALNLLLSRLHSDSLAYLRELIQNALDASRCRMYDDLRREGHELPESPDRAAADVRERYTIQVQHERSVSVDDSVGGAASVSIVTVVDAGVGMTRSVIEKYFLQVGRSFYASNEFRSSYSFNPSNRFGVGFLSLFAVSDHIVVETRSSDKNASGIRLVLTGPKSYLLVEEDDALPVGTTVRVRLRGDAGDFDFVGYLERLCTRVEFPVHFTDDSGTVRILTDSAKEFQAVVPDANDANAQIELIAYPFSLPGVKGEVYILQRRTGETVSFDRREWYRDDYGAFYPHAKPLLVPNSLHAVNGLTVGGGSANPIVRFDDRRRTTRLNLARDQLMRSSGLTDDELYQIVAPIVEDHLHSTPLAQGESGWEYIQRLVPLFPIDKLWAGVECVPVVVGGQPQYATPLLVTSQEVITLVVDERPGRWLADNRRTHFPPIDAGACSVASVVSRSLSDAHLRLIVQGRTVRSVRRLTDGFWAIDLAVQQTTSPEPLFHNSLMEADVFVVDVDLPIASIRIGPWHLGIANAKSLFVQWLLRIKEASESGEVSAKTWKSLAARASSVVFFYSTDIGNLRAHLQSWRKMTLPASLAPPEFALAAEEFVYWW